MCCRLPLFFWCRRVSGSYVHAMKTKQTKILHLFLPNLYHSTIVQILVPTCTLYERHRILITKTIGNQSTSSLDPSRIHRTNLPPSLYSRRAPPTQRLHSSLALARETDTHQSSNKARNPPFSLPQSTEKITFPLPRIPYSLRQLVKTHRIPLPCDPKLSLSLEKKPPLTNKACMATVVAMCTIEDTLL